VVGLEGERRGALPDRRPHERLGGDARGPHGALGPAAAELPAALEQALAARDRAQATAKNLARLIAVEAGRTEAALREKDELEQTVRLLSAQVLRSSPAPDRSLRRSGHPRRRRSRWLGLR